MTSTLWKHDFIGEKTKIGLKETRRHTTQPPHQKKWCNAVEQSVLEYLIPPQALDAGRDHCSEAPKP